jgi:hypothetical protein
MTVPKGRNGGIARKIKPKQDWNPVEQILEPHVWHQVHMTWCELHWAWVASLLWPCCWQSTLPFPRWLHSLPVVFLGSPFPFLASPTSWGLLCSLDFTLTASTLSSWRLPAGILTLSHIAWPPRSSLEISVEASMTPLTLAFCFAAKRASTSHQ